MVRDLRNDLRVAATALSDAIVAAGAARRNELGPPALPENETARAVVLSGRRARGEALSESDAKWLPGSKITVPESEALRLIQLGACCWPKDYREPPPPQSYEAVVGQVKSRVAS